MGKARIPGDTESDAGGEIHFLNLAMKAYLQANQGSEKHGVQILSKCLHSENISLYVTSINIPEPGSKGLGGYELVAARGDKVRCMKVECDSGLQIKDVKKISPEQLSEGSKEFYDEIKSGKYPEAAPPKLIK